ncbi:Uncharacterised protein [Mycobacteroides abscessus subsp. abscessus]|nr:Uncharacterised protein [Mycobacteroides abscessus subsp. abscessus]
MPAKMSSAKVDAGDASGSRISDSISWISPLMAASAAVSSSSKRCKAGISRASKALALSLA